MNIQCASEVVLAAAATVTVAAIQTPDTTDMVAVLGALLATVIAVVEARKKDRTLGNTVCVVIGSSFTGGVVPGAVMIGFYPELAARLTWHGWAVLGFLCGLCGWSIVLAAIGILRSRQDKILKDAADRILGPEEKK